MNSLGFLRRLMAYVACLVCFSVSAQSVMMQGWYWDYPKATGSAAWSANLASKAADLGTAGFTHVWLPPLSRASFGFNSNGYDPQDLYDLGEFGQGPTGFGTRAQADAAIAALSSAGIESVADVVYNHRDGGKPEVNPAVRDYITQHITAQKAPMPSDRWFCRLPLGGTSGNGAGDYYFKISSKSGGNQYYNSSYKVFMRTSVVSSSQGNLSEDEINGGIFNGGSDCSQGFNETQLGYDFFARLDDNSNNCLTDELKLTIAASDFNAAGDYLDIFLTNNGQYTDHRIYGIYSTASNSDVVAQLEYLTYTDFTNMPSGQGGMNFESFKPNSLNTSTTFLSGDYDYPWFFYDYDQSNPTTVQALNDWTSWLFDDVGISGLRMDAVKHFDPAYIGQLLDFLAASGRAPSVAVGEFFDGNVGTLVNWVNGVQRSMTNSSVNVQAFDFSLRNALKSACDNGGSEVRGVFNSGLVDAGGLSGFNSVTFVNNHDFRGGGEPVQSDPLLAYAYLLTNNQVGLPCVFYPDYYGDQIPNAPANALKPSIDSLIEFQALNLAGAQSRTYLNNFSSGFSANYVQGQAGQALIYQLRDIPSGKDVVVAINFGFQTLKVDHEIEMANPTLVPGTQFTDVMSRSAFPFAVVDGSNRIYLEVPARSYAIWQQSSAPLPAELLSFEASRIASGEVSATWTVGTEIDVAHYELVLDTETDERLSTQQQTASGIEAYGLRVADPAPHQDLYASLLIHDQDGALQRSNVVHLPAAAFKEQLRLSPNPAQDHLIINTPTRHLGQAFEIYSSDGKRVRRGRLETPSTILDVSELPASTYSIRILGGSFEASQQFIVE